MNLLKDFVKTFRKFSTKVVLRLKINTEQEVVSTDAQSNLAFNLGIC